MLRSGPDGLPAIHSVSLSSWDPVYSVTEHVNPFTDLIHVTKGGLRLHIGGRVYPGEEGDTLVVPRGQRHRDEFPVDPGFEALLVQFAWEAADRLFPAGINRDLVALPAVEKRAVKRAAFELYDVFRSTQPLAPELSTARLHVLLLTLLNGTERRARRRAEPPPSRAAQVIAEAKEYVEDHLSGLVSLSDVARHLGMSPYHLSHVFSRTSGFRLSEYVGQRRMERAADLLADPKRRVSEVAYAVGFRDPNYFARVFRRHFDCSPSVYRSRLHRERRR